jgi:glycerol-1-phosphate dehydrogenase [NAD(P)+]
MSIQAPLLQMTEAGLEELKKRILNHWDEIQRIAARVPEERQITSWIKALDGPTTPAEIGLSPEEVALGLQSAHYLRDRFTLNRLAFWLQLPSGYPIA